MIPFPDISPIALQLGPVAVRWYGLAYVAGMLGGLWLAKRLASRHPARNLSPDTMENAFLAIILGVVLGGRLGYVLFYALPTYGFGLLAADPTYPFRVWEGGMSFHGGVIGVVLAMFWVAWKHRIHPLDLADRITPVLPIGLFFGRIANFINGELWGRVTSPELPWAMVFPHAGPQPRHPSQLYEAGLEGLVLFALLWLTTRKGITRYQPSGVFLTGYALARIFVENFRTPEITHTYMGLQLTQGQLLSLPMLVVGLVFLYVASRAR
ncbi:MAG: prolipoprotein diacylglyceryl transferase [Pseudomonadaceae bacterium]|nr:prolipoprotein diacylglyceryl transferase [Pseudomonadaceae bacterium]